jgi:voltage-dependent anion channel protein 2
MPVPIYSDAGKKIREFFEEGFFLGLFKVSARLKTPTTRHFNVNGTYNFADKSCFWEVDTRRKYRDFGLNYVSKWNTNGIAITDIFYRWRGLRFGIGSDFNVETFDAANRLSLRFKHDKATFELGTERGIESNRLLTGSLMLGRNGLYTGAQVAFDTDESAVKKHSIAVGYRNCEWIIHSAVENYQTIFLGLHYRPNCNFEIASLLKYDTSAGDSTIGGEDVPATSETTTVEVGFKWHLDPFASIKAKVNNNSEVAIGYEIKLKPEVSMTMGMMINGNNFVQGEGGGGKLGFALDFK